LPGQAGSEPLLHLFRDGAHEITLFSGERKRHEKLPRIHASGHSGIMALSISTLQPPRQSTSGVCYPSSMTAQQILEQALRLNEEERVVVASSLLESLEAPSADLRTDDEWSAEIERRAHAALAGSPSLTWAEARARVEKRLDLR
jgi:Putative addiction module component